MKIHYAIVFLAFMLVCEIANAQADQTSSPYFLINTSKDSGTQKFPLESTVAEVQISGVIAAVTIRQHYRNQGSTPIEAVYIFPASTRAAVNAMKMTIGERVIEATVKEKGEAKATYEQAKQDGKQASLLEQQRPNVFQMNVANILPGESVKVELSYTELLIPENGEYSFVYPTVVGPRFNGEAAKIAPSANPWVANPYLEEDEPAPYRFDITIAIDTSVPIQALASSSHKLDIHYEDEDSASIKLAKGDGIEGDRDFILNYRLQGLAIESGLMLHEGENENFFLLMSQPPERITHDQLPNREYIFIVDVSGSMRGFPLDICKTLMTDLLSALQPGDMFNIVFFAGGSKMLAEQSLPATPSNIQQALTMMNRIDGSGGTHMLEAIKHAMASPSDDKTSRSFVIMTDGFVSIEVEAFQYVRENLNGANFFAFGIGSSVNRFLIEGLARAGRGEPFIVTDPQTAHKTAKNFRRYIQFPVLSDIELDFGGLDVYDVEPQNVPDILAERPLIVFGKWRGKAEGMVRIRGYGGAGEFKDEIPIQQVKHASHPSLRYLWARERIANLADYQKLAPNSERTREITTLGLTYNLLTPYTSFVAVSNEIINNTGESKRVKQPLPLPQGVSNHAVSGGVPTAPEPQITALLAILACLGLWRYYRFTRHRLVRTRL